MSQPHPLLAKIDAFLPVSGLSETTFGRLAVDDGKFVARLRNGGRVWPETAQRVEDFIASGRSNQRQVAQVSA